METTAEPRKHTWTRRPQGDEQEPHGRGGTEPNATSLKPFRSQLDQTLPSSIHPTLQWGKETVGGVVPKGGSDHRTSPWSLGRRLPDGRHHSSQFSPSQNMNVDPAEAPVLCEDDSWPRLYLHHSCRGVGGWGGGCSESSENT